MEIVPCRFDLPGTLQRFRTASNPHYDTFVIEPIPSGYGLIIGHALRQILCSSLDGAFFDGIDVPDDIDPQTAFTGLDEGLIGLIANLRGMRINLHVDGPHTLVLKARGPGSLSVGDIQSDPRVEFINPDHYLATLNTDTPLHLLIKVRRGAYCEQRRSADGAFRNVRQVKYRVDTRPTNRYEEGDRVILQVWTNGELLPIAATEKAMELLRQQYAIYGPPVRHIVFAEDRPVMGHVQSELMRKLEMSVNEFELSVRSANCLNNANIQTIGDLIKYTEAELLRFRNFGRKSLVEIRGILAGLDLSLGMDVGSIPVVEATQPWSDPVLDSRLSQSVNELDLSVRAANCLNNANIQTIGELVAKTEAELLKYRNFGRTSLEDIKKALTEMGLSLGMESGEAVQLGD